MRKPGFVGSLSRDLEAVWPEFKKRVHREGGLSDRELLALTTRMDADPAMYHPDHASEKQVSTWSDVTPIDELRGEQAIKDGEVAFVLLAGGVGTRIGEPKLFARLPKIGLSLLGWKLLQAGNMPVWVMVDPHMSEEIQRHVSSLALPLGMNGSIFEQFVGYRLTPDNRLLLVDGVPQLYPLGHGDVGPALVESGVLDDHPAVKYAYICNVDNVLAGPHPGVIGRHIRCGATVTCEVVERHKDDRGGVLAWVNNHLQVAEDFRLPSGFAEEAKYYNTNTMLINTDALRWPIPWRWHRVRKQVNNQVVVQYERLLQQYTEETQADFLLVPREARYCAVKTLDDLELAGEVLESYRFQ